MDEVRESTDHIPPIAIEEEQAVLAACLIDKDCITDVLEVVSVSSFYREQHRKIFAAIQYLDEKGKDVDYLTVADELERRDQLEEVGGAYYLTTLADSLPTSASAVTYAKIVREKEIRRELLKVSDAINDSASNGVALQELFEKTERSLLALATGESKSQIQSFSELTPVVMDKISDYHKSRKGITGISTGIKALDEKTGGLENGDLIVVAARPSIGKTAFSINNLAITAAKAGVPVGVFSLEMKNERLMMRSIAAAANVNHHRLTHGKLSDKDWAMISLKIGEIASLPIYMHDDAGMTIFSIRSVTRRMKQKHGIGMIVIDYLQRIKSGKSYQNRALEVGMMSQSCKTLALELDIPVVLLSQLSRTCEQRSKDAKPILSDIKESGDVEQDADVVMFLWRPEVYGIDYIGKGSDRRKATPQIIIGKQRNGPIGGINVGFKKEQMLWVDLDSSHQESPGDFDDDTAPF